MPARTEMGTVTSNVSSAIKELSRQLDAAAEQIASLEGLFTEPVDKVSESRMAELIGVTKYTLEGKRKRGRIPEGVWMKVDGRIFYSIRRWEVWLESLWLPYPPTSIKANSAKGRRYAEPVLQLKL